MLYFPFQCGSPTRLWTCLLFLNLFLFKFRHYTEYCASAVSLGAIHGGFLFGSSKKRIFSGYEEKKNTLGYYRQCRNKCKTLPNGCLLQMKVHSVMYYSRCTDSQKMPLFTQKPFLACSRAAHLRAAFKTLEYLFFKRWLQILLSQSLHLQRNRPKLTYLIFVRV